MKDVGIRELKTRASEIVRHVREDRERYVVTDRGRPVGLLGPLDEVDGQSLEEKALAWNDLDRLTVRIRKGWRSRKSGVNILSGMRR